MKSKTHRILTAVKKIIKVFIASPSDLVEERRVFRDSIKLLNIGFGDGAGVEFEPLGWEDCLASTGRRSQSVINHDIDSCDVFILTLYRRWGQLAPDAHPYSSYTEEEFHRALDRWRNTKSPEIFVFFKRVDTASEADPGEQLRKVMDFRRQLEDSREVLYHYYDSSESFKDEVDRHLRAYAKGELADVKLSAAIVMPLCVLQEVEKAKLLALQMTRAAKKANDYAREAYLRLEATQLQLAEDAALLAKEGKLEFARENFSRLMSDSVNIRILYLCYEFFERTGDHDSAGKVLEKWFEICGEDACNAATAAALYNLGILCSARGDIDRAEEIYLKALAIDERINRKSGMATAYGNLGGLYIERDQLDKAEEMLKKSLKLHREIANKEGEAINLGNLAVLYNKQGDFCGAEAALQSCVEINTLLKNNEGLARDYGNLGGIYARRGQLEQAEEMTRLSLAMSETIGRKSIMANGYANLGYVFDKKGDVAMALVMFKKALDLFELLESKVDIATCSRDLGELYKKVGERKSAEESYRKSLEVFLELRSPEAGNVARILEGLLGKSSVSQEE